MRDELMLLLMTIICEICELNINKHKIKTKRMDSVRSSTNSRISQEKWNPHAFLIRCFSFFILLVKVFPFTANANAFKRLKNRKKRTKRPAMLFGIDYPISGALLHLAFCRRQPKSKATKIQRQRLNFWCKRKRCSHRKERTRSHAMCCFNMTMAKVAWIANNQKVSGSTGCRPWLTTSSRQTRMHRHVSKKIFA